MVAVTLVVALLSSAAERSLFSESVVPSCAMDILPQFFPPLLSDLLSQKGDVMSLDRIKFEDMLSNPGADSLAKALTPFWSDQNFRELPGWCQKIDCDPEDILLVFTSESRLRPDALAPRVGSPVAVGLNQMTRIAMQVIGKLPADETQAKTLFPALAYAMAKAGVREQMEQIVTPYFDYVRKTYKGPWTATALYMANAAPSLMSKATDPDAVIYGKGSDAFEQNKGLDTNNDGQITTKDLMNAVNYHRETPEYVAAKYRYRKINKLPPFSDPMFSLPGGGFPG